MPHPPKIKISKEEMREREFSRHPFPFQIDDLPPQVADEVREKIERGEKHVQFRMPIEVWARLRARHFEMNKDAHQILEKNHMPLPSPKFGADLVPMSEIIRKMFDNPLQVKDQDIVGMIHKKGKGRIFR